MKRITFIIICLLFLSHSVYGASGRLKKGTWQQSWNDTLKASIKSSGLLEHREKAISDLCPNYNSSSQAKMIFWQQLMVSLAWKESIHGPRNYIHFNGGINKGLYQINPVLRTAYGCKGYDLYDPIQNIRCGVKMAKRLVSRYKSFLTGSKGGMAAYWQPLRASSKLNRRNRAKILSEVKSACQSRSIAYISTSKKLTSYAGNIDPYEEVDLSFNTMDGEDINLEGQDLEIETGIEEDLDHNIIIDNSDDIIEV